MDLLLVVSRKTPMTLFLITIHYSSLSCLDHHARSLGENTIDGFHILNISLLVGLKSHNCIRQKRNLNFHMVFISEQRQL